MPFLAPVIPRLCLTVFTFAQPFLINSTVTFVSNGNPDVSYGRGLIGAWALVYLGITVSNSVYQYHNLRFTTRLRGGLIALVYQQAVYTRDVDTGDITAVALMGTDVERIFGAMSMFHTTWGSLLDIAVASWLLGLQLSLACLAPIVLVLGMSRAANTVWSSLTRLCPSVHRYNVEDLCRQQNSPDAVDREDPGTSPCHNDSAW